MFPSEAVGIPVGDTSFNVLDYFRLFYGNYTTTFTSEDGVVIVNKNIDGEKIMLFILIKMLQLVMIMAILLLSLNF